MKKTILFALSALLVGACAKEDPEEKEIFPDVPPRGFHLDKRPFYLLESTYDAVAFSKSVVYTNGYGSLRQKNRPKPTRKGYRTS